MGHALPFLQKLSFNFYAFVAILISKECIEPLGMQSGEIKDYQITASSSRPADLPQYGRLHNGKYWCAAKKSKNEYFQVDLGQVCKISRVVCTFCLTYYLMNVMVSLYDGQFTWCQRNQNFCNHVLFNTDASVTRNWNSPIPLRYPYRTGFNVFVFKTHSSV